MVKYLFRKNPHILLYFILSPLRALSSVAVAGALSIAIEYANGGELDQVWNYIIFFGIYIILDLLIDASDQAVRLKIIEKTMVALKSDVYCSVSRTCYTHFFQQNSADYLSNMTTDMETLRDSLFSVMLNMYSDFLRCAVAIGILVWISPILGIFVLVTSLVQTLVPVLYSKKLEYLGKVYSDKQEQQMKVLKEGLSAFLTAKIFHIEEKLERNYLEALEQAEESRRKSRFLKEWSSSLSYVFNQIAHLGVFLLGAVLVIKGTITVAEVIAASELIVYISYPVLWLNGELAELRTAKEAQNKILALLSEPNDCGGKQEKDSKARSITIRDLNFSYGDRIILHHLDYHFEEGKKYLILGTSGSGKSTLINLIAGLRSDYEGSIFLGDEELRSLSRSSITKTLCAINQEPFLFDDTLYNNVCLFEKIDEAQVLQALRRVELQGLVAQLPDGIHTSLGENASTMSGGEKQRLIIARALVRNTPILLLDESTSHLDASTAAEIERLVLGLEGITVLLVSHNATEIAKTCADEILEVYNGKLISI